MKLFFKALLFSVFFLSLPHFFKSDFKLPPVHAKLPSNPHWNSPSPTEEILTILRAPFTYYARGNQATVFISEDGQYVLKLFRYQRSLFPFVHWIKNCYKEKSKQSFQSKIQKTFNATHLASTEGQEFTQVLYYHLNLTKQTLPITTLKVGNKHYRLALDQTRFALQKRADPFKKTLFDAKDDPEKMRRLIESFANLLAKRASKNIRNSDHNLWPNFGFLEDKAVEIDFGNYQKPESNNTRQKEEISQFLISLEQWLAKRAPQYLNFAIELRRKIENNYTEQNEDS